mgnify:CR=1 FL=1
MVYQLTKNLSIEEAKTAGFDAYYIDHTAALWPQAAAGVPFTALEFQSKGDALADLTEDLAAEQKARKSHMRSSSLPRARRLCRVSRTVRCKRIILLRKLFQQFLPLFLNLPFLLQGFRMSWMRVQKERQINQVKCGLLNFRQLLLTAHVAL